MRLMILKWRAKKVCDEINKGYKLYKSQTPSMVPIDIMHEVLRTFAKSGLGPYARGAKATLETLDRMAPQEMSSSYTPLYLVEEFIMNVWSGSGPVDAKGDALRALVVKDQFESNGVAQLVRVIVRRELVDIYKNE